MKKRVVITGMGVMAPGAPSSNEFLMALKEGRNAIVSLPELTALNFGCSIGGVVKPEESPIYDRLEPLGLAHASDFVKLSCLAGIEAWQDAGFVVPPYGKGETDEHTGLVMGSGIGPIDTINDMLIPYTDKGRVRRMRSTIVEYTMFSASTATLAGALALGNASLAVASACASSTDAIILAADRIRSGRALRMLAGGTEVFTPYSWAGFDAMRLLTTDFNDTPLKGSRPMSATASGFVPSSGAGVIVLEELETAIKRGARIYAELSGSFSNSGGQRNGGTMTIPNNESVVKCIRGALNDAETSPQEVDLISGHLTSTMADPIEVANWSKALDRGGEEFPFINATKSIFGHMIGAAGVAETIASVLQIHNNFIHPSINCEDIHPEVKNYLLTENIPHTLLPDIKVNCVLKAGFGFGDVNTCLVLKKFIR